VATISGLGTLAGIASGTSVILYTLPTSCSAFVVATVSTISPITGALSVCVGQTTTLADVLSGGTWSSGSTGVATVSAGTVSGISAGVADITYSYTGCVTDAMVTVNPLPAPSISVSSPTLSTTLPYVTYQWQLAGAAIAGATNATYDVLVNGVYSVIVTDSNGCSGTSDVVIVTNVGVQNINFAADGIKVYPNPNDGSFSVNVLSGTPGIAEIMVDNVVGETIKTFTATVNKTEHVQLNVPAGMYFLTATTADGQKRVVKLIVQ
jgi:hypothetical protein